MNATTQKLIKKLYELENNIQSTLFTMGKQYRYDFSIWVQHPNNSKEVASYLAYIMPGFDVMKQIAVIRYATRMYSIEEMAEFLLILNQDVDISKLKAGLTLLWHQDRKKELDGFLNT